jgi:hypothetical protein
MQKANSTVVKETKYIAFVVGILSIIVAGWAILVFILITYYKLKCGLLTVTNEKVTLLTANFEWIK